MQHKREWGWMVCVALCALAHLLLAAHSAHVLSVTHDEYWHLPVGVLHLQTGRYDWETLNPPLSRMFAAIPVAGARLEGLRTPVDSVALGDAFLQQNRDNYAALLWRGRMMNLLWSVATGILLALWARQLFGRSGAAVTGLFWLTCPNALAHGALVTPDMALTFFSTAALYAAWHYARRATFRRALGCGAALGGALLVKYTAIVWVPGMVLAWLVWKLAGSDCCFGHIGDGQSTPSSPAADVPRRPSWWLLLWQFGAAGGLALVLLNAGYLFERSFQPMARFQFQSQSLRRLEALPDGLRQLPVPLPAAFLEGIDRQRAIMEQSHPVYLDGEWRTSGFPQYFLMCLVYKIPHAAQLAALLGALLILLLQRRGIGFWSGLLIAPALLFGVASLSGMQLGIRYILPALIVIPLLAGGVAQLCWNRRLRVPGVMLAVCVLLAPLSLRHHPEHLACFNELAGGPIGGRAHLLDSNLDWGQDLTILRERVRARGIKQLNLLYFGTLPPRDWGLEFQVPGRRLSPGWYALSVNFVEGRPHSVRLPDGGFRAVDVHEFSGFKKLTPAEHVGASIELYEIP